VSQDARLTTKVEAQPLSGQVTVQRDHLTSMVVANTMQERKTPWTRAGLSLRVHQQRVVGGTYAHYCSMKVMQTGSNLAQTTVVSRDDGCG